MNSKRRTNGNGEVERRCPRCCEWLLLTLFVRSRNGTDGYGGYCRPCQAAKTTEWEIRTGKSRQYARKRDEESKLKRRVSQLVNRNGVIGVSVPILKACMEKQDNRCAICKRAGKLVADHDHSTNQFRALLCDRCNRGLGFLGENIGTLTAAISYLKLFSAEKDVTMLQENPLEIYTVN